MDENTKRKAADFLSELENDVVYQNKRTERDLQLAARDAELAQDEKELVRKIRALGADITSVWDLVNNAPHPLIIAPGLGVQIKRRK